MIVIGIDPGTHCGWAVRDGFSLANSGVWDLKPKDNEDTRVGLMYTRLINLVGESRDAVVSPITITYEDVKAHAGTIAAHVYGELVGIIKLVAHVQHTGLLPLGVGQIKKFATGKGTADKEAMIEYARRQWPDWKRERYDHNEADARWIAELGWHTLQEGHEDE